MLLKAATPPDKWIPVLEATSKPGGIGGSVAHPQQMALLGTDVTVKRKGTFSWRRALQLLRAAFNQPRMSLRLFMDSPE